MLVTADSQPCEHISNNEWGQSAIYIGLDPGKTNGSARWKLLGMKTTALSLAVACLLHPGSQRVVESYSPAMVSNIANESVMTQPFTDLKIRRDHPKLVPPLSKQAHRCSWPSTTKSKSIEKQTHDQIAKAREFVSANSGGTSW